MLQPEGATSVRAHTWKGRDRKARKMKLDERLVDSTQDPVNSRVQPKESGRGCGGMTPIGQGRWEKRSGV